MKKFLFAFFIQALVFTGVHAQPNIAQKYTGYIDSLLNLASIKRQNIETGILYERTIPFAALQSFQQTDTISRGYFLQAALELGNAAYDTLPKKTSKTKDTNHRQFL